MSIFSTGPARRTTSHSVICNAIPPMGATPAAPAASAEPLACSLAAAHCPSWLTKSALVSGRSVISFLPAENVAQSGLRISVSGFGTSVRLFRLRSEEHAPKAGTSAAMASARHIIRFDRCIANAPNSHERARRARRAGFCVSTITLINRAFCPLRVPSQGRPRARCARPYTEFDHAAGDARPTPDLSRLQRWLRDAHRDDPGDPQEQKIHRQEGGQARSDIPTL